MRKIKASIKLKQTFSGRTLAYRRFVQNFLRTQNLLETGLSGIESRLEKTNELLEKFKAVKGIRGPRPKDFKPVVEEESRDEEGNVTIKFDARTGAFIRKTMEHSLKQENTLRFHLYSILTVYIWGAFETYLVMLFEELFKKKPEMLKSEETITFREVVDRHIQPLDLLVERQIDRIGHFTLREMMKYLADKINFNFGTAREKQLAQLYLIRNIVAHNTGLVRDDMHGGIPKSIKIQDNELRITKSFLESMTDSIQKSVMAIEKHVTAKFFKD